MLMKKYKKVIKQINEKCLVKKEQDWVYADRTNAVEYILSGKTVRTFKAIPKQEFISYRSHSDTIKLQHIHIPDPLIIESRDLYKYQYQALIINLTQKEYIDLASQPQVQNKNIGPVVLQKFQNQNT